MSVIRNFLKKHTFPGLLLLIGGSMFFAEVLFVNLCGYILGSIGINPEPFSDIALIFGGFLSLFFFRCLFRKEYHPLPIWENFGRSLRYAYPIYLIWVFILGMYAFFAKGFPMATPDAEIIMRSISAGLVEEIIFREISISFLQKKWIWEDRNMIIVAISAVIFGGFHLFNVFFGNSLVTVFFQVIICLLAGMFYGSIYILNGNVWAVILLHSLHNIIVFSERKLVVQEGIDLPQIMNIVYMFGFALLAVYGVFITLNDDDSEIRSLWKRIWRG